MSTDGVDPFLDTVLDIGPGLSSASVSVRNTKTVSTQDMAAVADQAEQRIAVLENTSAGVSIGVLTPPVDVLQGPIIVLNERSSGVEQRKTLSPVIREHHVVTDEAVIVHWVI